MLSSYHKIQPPFNTNTWLFSVLTPVCVSCKEHHAEHTTPDVGSEVLTRRKQLLLSNLLDSSLKHTGHVTHGACSLCSPWEAVSALAHESYSTPREWLCISLLKSEALSTHSSNFVRSTLNSICTSHVISQFPISLVSSADLSGVSFHHFSH